MPEDANGSGSRFADVGGAVLLGGRSNRMGTDKAALEVGGMRNDVRVTRLLARLFEEVLVVGGAAPEGLRVRAVPDPDGPACALRGLVGALEAARSARVLVVAVDMPLLTPDLLLALVAWPEADAVVPQTDDGIHPLCALYRRDAVLAAARERLARRELKLRGVLDAVDSCFVGAAALGVVEASGGALTNVNTPEELARVEERLSRN
jgi:molybdopterin-guanine dinucleotide biosynthesis protein A